MKDYSGLVNALIFASGPQMPDGRYNDVAQLCQAAASAITTLTARVEELEEVLDECETYFDNRADAEYFTDSPFPVGNEEMGLLVTVRKAKKGSDA